MKPIPVLADFLSRLTKHIRELNRNWIIRISNIGVVMITIASLLSVAFTWSRLPPQVPLWYANPWGELRLAQSYWLIIIALIGSLWHAVNMITSALIAREYLVFSQLLHLTSLLVNMLVFIVIANVIFLIT